MMTKVVYVFLVLTVLMSAVVQGMMYGQQKPAKTIHVHHFDAGMSNQNMGGNYMKHSSGGDSGSSSLIELLLLSSLLGGGGLLGGTNTATATQPIGIPIQVQPGIIQG